MTHKELKKRAGQYLKFVEWSKQDQCFIGRCPSLFHGTVQGRDEAKVYRELCATVEQWLELLEKDGEALPQSDDAIDSYSGKFVVRVEPALHQRLVLKAQAAGESLNSFVVKALAEA